jgi:hypothetical protein
VYHPRGGQPLLAGQTLEPLVNSRSVRNVSLMMVVTAGLLVALIVPALAQEDGEAGEEPTPVPTMMPVASPPPALPSPSPSPAVTDLGFPAPPPVAAGVIGDSLKTGAIFPDGVCRTGYTLGDLIPDGLELTVLGRCPADQETPSLTVFGKGVTLADGDVALDFKVTGQPDRSRVNLFVRGRDDRLVLVSLNFFSNEATLVKRDGGANTIVASRGSLRDLANPTEWNRLALRVLGTEAWVLLNDEPILYADNVVDQVGGIGVGLLREGSTEDEAEAVVVFKDLTISSLPDTDPARAPKREGQ